MEKFPVPLNALRAIEIVARTGALKPAADELGVTVGAVSQHIRRAEARLGLDLFERTPQGLRPTEQLEAVRPLLTGGFGTLLDACQMLQRADDTILSLTLGSVFASRWLVRRLPLFTAAHPELELRLVSTGKLIDLGRTDIDCAIRYGDGRWPATRAEPLGCRGYSPVASPMLAKQLRDPRELESVPVITDQASMLSWPGWFAASGAGAVPFSGPTYSDPTLAFDAAIAGQGVLLTVDRMSEDAVRQGTLQRPFATSADSSFDYFFVTSTERRVPRKVGLFRDWLFSELAS